MNFEPAGHEGPCPFELAVTHRDPIIVARNKRDCWVVDLALPHRELAIFDVDPPVTTIRAAEIPLIFRVHALRLVGAKALPHSIEDLLRRGIFLRPANARERQTECENETDLLRFHS